jgi:hypothetical protein
MTTIGRCVEDKMRQQRNDDEKMGTAQPAGRIRRRRCNGSCRIGVGVKGSQEGGIGRKSWGSIAYQTHGGVRVTEFFFGDTTCLLARLISPPESMVHPQCKYLCRLIWGRGTRWCPQNWLGGVNGAGLFHFLGAWRRVSISTLTNKEIMGVFFLLCV